jgi:hypothetical protein
MGVDPERGRSPTGVADPARHRAEVDPPAMSWWPRSDADRAAESGGRAVWPAARTGGSPSPGAWAAGQPGRRRTHRRRRRATRHTPPPAQHSDAGAPQAAQRCLRKGPAGGRRGSLVSFSTRRPAAWNRLPRISSSPASRSTCAHRSAHSSPRRAPVVAASHSRAAKSGQPHKRSPGAEKPPLGWAGGSQPTRESGWAGQGRRVGRNPAQRAA